MKTLSRRDFLKVGAALSTATCLSSTWRPFAKTDGHKNILILLFDTMSARHLSLYGYPRETTPELSRFAERSTVFHSHISSSNFTSPSTGSLFLGMYPWKHRAHTSGGLVRRDFVPQNLFALFGDDFHRVAFAQTEYANILVNQFAGSVDRNIPAGAYSVDQSRYLVYGFLQDPLLRSYAPQTLLGQYFDVASQLLASDDDKSAFPEYPKGIPLVIDNGISFLLEDVFEGVFKEVQNARAHNRPHISYHHLYAPHNPYAPSREFLSMFQDDYKPVRKPDHPLSLHTKTYRNILPYQQRYDQYIAHVDREFGLLISNLEKEGLLEDTYVIVTSDHGELFERDTTGHAVPFLFESLIHIPLLIRAPGQTSRIDIHTPTSNVDLLPTLCSLMGLEIPPAVDGQVLPGFGGQDDPERAIYSMFSPQVSAFAPLSKGIFALRQGQHKLIYYKGYDKYPEAFELYDLQDDPDEIENLFTRNPSIAKQMTDRLLESLDVADSIYR